MTLSATGVGTSGQSTTSSLTVSVSATGGAGRVVIVVCTETNSDGNPATVSSMSGLSATWTKRAAVTNTTLGQASEEWYADFVASTSGTVTITMSATIDDAAVMAVFVSSSGGAVISWDTDPSLPAVLHGSVTSGSAGLTPVSSHSGAPYQLIMGGCANGSGNDSPTPVSTLLGLVNNVGGVKVQRANVYGGTPGRLSTTSSGYGSVGAAAANPTWTIIIDALTEPVVVPTSGMFLAMG